MPEKRTMERARKDAREGKSPSTQASEFVKEEMDHIREGKHGARSAKQAIAIGLSKARRAGVKLPPRKGSAKGSNRKGAVSAKRSRATTSALKREGSAAASHTALSRQARASARKRGATKRSQSARKAANTRARGSR
jgi:Family of unknown function (DUF6496)